MSQRLEALRKVALSASVSHNERGPGSEPGEGLMLTAKELRALAASHRDVRPDGDVLETLRRLELARRLEHLASVASR